MQVNQEAPTRITTALVHEAILSFVEVEEKDHFTTHDIARFMGVEEYPVRAAFTFLKRNNIIDIVPGVRTKRYLSPPADPRHRLHGDSYWVSVYQLKEEAVQVDFAALNRLFGY